MSSLLHKLKSAFPSGKRHALLRLNIPIQNIASNRDVSLDCYIEEGLGKFQFFILKLDSGIHVVFEQSDHLSNVSLFGEKAHEGPVVYIDAIYAVEYGFEKLYWAIIHNLNISEANIDAKPMNLAEWTEDAQRLINLSTY